MSRPTGMELSEQIPSTPSHPASSAPIGIFDSGIGGLSVLREIARRLPHEDFLYFADSANCPYGHRPVEEIRELSRRVAHFLIEQGAKLVVVACNTASATALHLLRETFSTVPVVGMVPAVKPASLTTRTGVVGVLATPATVAGALYADVVQRFAQGVQVVEGTGEGLVPAVEAGQLDGPETEALLRRYLDPMLAAGADTIVLGCTHYPFLEPVIRRIVGPAVNILDPSPAVAKQVERVLEQRGLLATRERPGRHSFFTSGDPEVFSRLLRIVYQVG